MVCHSASVIPGCLPSPVRLTIESAPGKRRSVRRPDPPAVRTRGDAFDRPRIARRRPGRRHTGQHRLRHRRRPRCGSRHASPTPRRWRRVPASPPPMPRQRPTTAGCRQRSGRRCGDAASLILPDHGRLAIGADHGPTYGPDAGDPPPHPGRAFRPQSRATGRGRGGFPVGCPPALSGELGPTRRPRRHGAALQPPSAHRPVYTRTP